MSLLVVGSVALDSIFTPFGETADALGGSAVYFSVAGSLLHPVQVVGVVGDDFPVPELERLAARGIDWSGVERSKGESFRWKGKYSYDLQSRETLETRLGVFADFQPKIPAAFRSADFVFLGNIDPELQIGVLGQVQRPKLVVCDTMNYWIQGKKAVLLDLLRRVDVLMVNDSEARELSGDWNIHRAGRWILDHGPSRVVIKQGEYGAMLIERARTFTYPPSRWRRCSTRPAPATPSPAGSWPISHGPARWSRTTSAGPWCTAPRWAPTRWSSSGSGGSSRSVCPTSRPGSAPSRT
jgi:sugar/nucleoside kinase (ribokinase family)